MWVNDTPYQRAVDSQAAMLMSQTAAQNAADCGSSALCSAVILLLPDLESIDIQPSYGRVVPWRRMSAAQCVKPRFSLDTMKGQTMSTDSSSLR